MTLIAATLQAFFTDRLSRQRQASPRTIAAYRDTLRLLLVFLQQRTGTPPEHPHQDRHETLPVTARQRRPPTRPTAQYAMSLLQAGVDTTVIALWLGHASVRSTDAYVHADMSTKERALALTTPLTARPGRYRPTDETLAFLDGL
jgi:site-specific recombinase XerD